MLIEDMLIGLMLPWNFGRSTLSLAIGSCMGNSRRFTSVLLFLCAVNVDVSRASLPVLLPPAAVHVCVLFKPGTFEADDRSLKAAHNFGNLVADHLRDGSRSLSVSIWKGTLDRPNTNEWLSQNDPSPDERAYLESVFCYEIGRIATRIVYLRPSIPAKCGVEASAYLDVSMSGALCGTKSCEIECAETECKKQ